MEWLVIGRHDYQKDSHGWRAVLDQHLNIQLDSIHPVIRKEDSMFIGLAKVYEYHITSNGSIIFFTMDTKSIKGKEASTIEWLYKLTNGLPTRASASGKTYASTSGFNDSSTMDPAMAMTMGLGRDPNEVARRAGRRSGDDGSMSIEDIMRMRGEDI